MPGSPIRRIAEAGGLRTAVFVRNDEPSCASVPQPSNGDFAGEEAGTHRITSRASLRKENQMTDKITQEVGIDATNALAALAKLDEGL